MDTKIPSLFQGVPDAKLLWSLLETYPFRPVLILTLSIYSHIFLLLIVTYQNKIPFSISTPNKCGGESLRDTQKGKETQQCKKQGRAGGCCPLMLHGGRESGLSSWDLPRHASSSKRCPYPMGPGKD